MRVKEIWRADVYMEDGCYVNSEFVEYKSLANILKGTRYCSVFVELGYFGERKLMAFHNDGFFVCKNIPLEAVVYYHRFEGKKYVKTET